MSPSKRERDYARRRHREWQARRAQRSERRRRRLQWLGLVGALLAVVLVVGGIWWLTGGAGDETAAGATPDPRAQADPTDVDATGQGAEQGTGSNGDNPCPVPTSGPVADPLQLPAAPDPSTAGSGTRTATIETSCGPLTVDLFADEAPAAVASFVSLVQRDFFASTPCHRLTTEGIFVLQCGDPTGTGQGGPGYTFGPVENAPADDLYPAGTLAMARVGGDAASMGSQFFVVYEDSTIPSDTAGGYTVFGRVTDGLDVVDRVAQGGVGGGGGDGAPARPVSIQEVTVP